MVLIVDKSTKKSDVQKFLKEKKEQSKKKKNLFSKKNFDYVIDSFKDIDAVEYQRKIRNEWK